ncbi:MAG: nucleotidyltransferase family protein [Novosphingobium sp.]
MTTGNIAALLLAAGRGSRFGGGKLGAVLAGKPVASHAAEKLASLPFARRLVVCSPTTPVLDGFERLPLDPADAPMSRSIAAGIAAISDAQAVLIALADMPLVPAGHFERLVEAFAGDRIGTRVGGRIMAPAIFGAVHFPALSALQGDQGAASLLQTAPALPLAEMLALDVDTRDDLARAELILQGL